MLKRLPNILTMSRIVVIPLLVCVMYWDGRGANLIAFTLFTVAGITDFFDGYLARATGAVSKLGQFLDPIADKLMVAATIVMLIFVRHVEGIHVIALMVILCREIMVSGLREFLAVLKVSVPVTQLAKWKTTFQMLALGALILGDVHVLGLSAIWFGLVCLWLSAALTLITGYDYLRAGLRHMT